MKYRVQRKWVLKLKMELFVLYLDFKSLKIEFHRHQVNKIIDNLYTNTMKIVFDNNNSYNYESLFIIL